MQQNDAPTIPLDGSINEPPIAIGSQVFLQSGGPSMTVIALGAQGTADVIWFSMFDEMQEKYGIPLAALTLTDKNNAIEDE